MILSPRARHTRHPAPPAADPIFVDDMNCGVRAGITPLHQPPSGSAPGSALVTGDRAAGNGSEDMASSR